MCMSETGCLTMQFQEGLTLRESFQLAEKQCAEKKVVLVGAAVFPCPNTIKGAGKSGEAD